MGRVQVQQLYVRACMLLRIACSDGGPCWTAALQIMVNLIRGVKAALHPCTAGHTCGIGIKAL